MARSKSKDKDSKGRSVDEQPTLFAIGPPVAVEPEVKKPRYPVWTENKAVLIQRYLRYFVLVTKHGTYIDCFAGPQDPAKPNMWAAKLVVESQPRWLRQIFLCEKSVKKVALLRDLVKAQAPRAKKEPKRAIEVVRADCNAFVPGLLASGKLKPAEATFCLLDQRTFECDWATIVGLSRHRTKQYKIELFYFLANSWLERAIAGVKTKKTETKVQAWWGRPDWKALRTLSSVERADLVCKRLREELGYKSAKAWPIYEREDGGKIMYFMVHATDHPEAPKLMARAYNRAVMAPEPIEQLTLESLLSGAASV